MGETDIVVIGAGAAGLAAARVLARIGVDFLVLEARDRLGGRAFTLEAEGYALDLGCGWLHSADANPLAGMAESLGFALDKTPPPWARPALNTGSGQAGQAGFAQALAALEARIEAAAARGEDRPVSGLMDPDSRFTPMLDAFSSYYNGAEFDCISTLDYAAYEDSGVNWRVERGYGALVAALAGAAPVRLNTPVRCVDHSGRRLRIETPGGDLTARAAIVTVPTALLAEGTLAFRPDLPEPRAAAEALPLGLANKVFLRLDEPEAFPAESRLHGDATRAETGSYHLRPFGRPLIEAYLGGRHARALEAEGPGAGAAFAMEELAGLLGSSVRSKLTPVAASQWAGDPWAGGSYSHAAPGGAWARAALARPVEDRIYFSGEAASPRAFSTAHGAAQAGAEAARRAAAAIRPA